MRIFLNDCFDAVALENGLCLSDLVRCRHRCVLEFIGEAGATILVFAHLMKGEDFHTIDVAQLADKFSEAFDVFDGIGQSGNQYEAYPYFVTQPIQALCKF